MTISGYIGHQTYEVDLSRLRRHIARPNFLRFQKEFEAAVTRQGGSPSHHLRLLGAEALEALIESSPKPDPDVLNWFFQQFRAGSIEPTERLLIVLTQLQRRTEQAAERERFAGVDGQMTIVQMKRVVQTSWFGFAGFEASDAIQIKRSVFRSQQERAFHRAVSARWPGCQVLPNYPLDQFIDLARIRRMVSHDAWYSGRLMRIDTLLVTPLEGDPIAAFEIDSRVHDEPAARKRDALKNELLVAARVPFFRLRSENPEATAADEWYSLLTDQVLDKVTVGERLRVRDTHAMLVPMYP